MSSDDVTITEHARQRWVARTSADAPPLEAAWLDAWELALPTPEYRNVDAGRYHRETNTVILARNSAVRTVLSMAPTAVSSGKGQALRTAVERQFDTDTSSESQVDDLETHHLTEDSTGAESTRS